jgi:hypothetical protein
MRKWVSSSSARVPWWTRLPLIAVLVVVAIGELLLNRIAGHLFHSDPLMPRTLLLRAQDLTRLFFYELTSVLAALLLIAALVRVVAFGARYRIGARVSFGLVGMICAALATLGAVLELPLDLSFHLHLSFTFLALLIVLSVAGARAPVRLKLGTVMLFLPTALHFAAQLTRRLSPAPELSRMPLDLEALAQATLVAAALVSVPCFAVRRQASRLAVGIAALAVGCGAVLVRIDWDIAARIALYGFGLMLPMMPWLLVICLLALGGFVYTVMTLVAASGNERLRGYGLALVGIAGLQMPAPFQVALAALGFLCIAESVVRGAGAPMPREAFEQLVRRGAAAVRAPQVVLTGANGYETARLQSPAGGLTVALTIARHGGLVSALDVVVGEIAPRDPPFTVEHKQSPRLGPRADGPAIDTGDPAFDAQFVTRDRRGINAQLLDDGTRLRMRELVSGWLGVWPQRGVHYRAETLVAGEDALPQLLALLQELVGKAA